MESLTQESGGVMQAFLAKHPQVKRQFELLSTQLKKKPQLLLVGVVAIFGLVGLVAAVSLVGVQQDIRQQASGLPYPGQGCNEPAGVSTCGVNNQNLVCAGGVWQVTGQACPSQQTSSNICGPSTVNKKVGRLTYNWDAATRKCYSNEEVVKRR